MKSEMPWPGAWRQAEVWYLARCEFTGFGVEAVDHQLVNAEIGGHYMAVVGRRHDTVSMGTLLALRVRPIARMRAASYWRAHPAVRAD